MMAHVIISLGDEEDGFRKSNSKFKEKEKMDPK